MGILLIFQKINKRYGPKTKKETTKSRKNKPQTRLRLRSTKVVKNVFLKVRYSLKF